LSDIVRELPEASVDLEIDDNHKMILICQKSNFKIHGLPKDDFPILPEVKKDKVFKVKGSLLQEMIRKTIFAVSTDETRYVLNGVYFPSGEAENLGWSRPMDTDWHLFKKN
jgi:DNA polymerase III subunit beta